MAVWHYPLRSDESSQDSDVYLQNSPSNPYQSSSLESLLAANGVKVVFNGHAHNYERIAPSGAGQITNYVTGGGGGVLEPVSTGSSCTGFKSCGVHLRHRLESDQQHRDRLRDRCAHAAVGRPGLQLPQGDGQRGDGHRHPDQRRRPVVRRAELHLLGSTTGRR